MCLGHRAASLGCGLPPARPSPAHTTRLRETGLSTPHMLLTRLAPGMVTKVTAVLGARGVYGAASVSKGFIQGGPVLEAWTLHLLGWVSIWKSPKSVNLGTQ